MNKLMAVLLALALVAPASAWTILGDNILGNNFDYVTLRSPSAGQSIVFNATTRKWEAGSATGSLGIQTGGVAQGSATTLDFTNGIKASSTAVAGTFNVSPTFGTSANTITQGNDARLNPTPSGAGKIVFDNGSAYVAASAGASTTVLHGGTAPSFSAIVSGDITDGTIAMADLANLAGLSVIGRSASSSGVPAAISGTANQILVVNSAGSALAFVTVSGDLTNVTGAFTIANNAVTTAKILDANVTDAKLRNSAGLTVIGRGPSTTGAPADIDGTANQILVVNNAGTALDFVTVSGDLTNVTGAFTIANNAVNSAKIAANAVANADFRQGVARSLVGVAGNATADVADIQGTANQIPIVNSAGTALAFTSLSGDVTNSSGVMTIAAQAVGVAKMTASATDVVFGRSSAGAGAGQEITFTSTARSIADDTSVSAVRTTLSAVGTVNVRVFTVDGTYTPTSGMLYCIVEAVGGGGGGGGSDGTAGNCLFAAGGGAGGRTIVLLTAAEVGASKAVDIGAGGGGASAGSGTGTAGSDTTLGTTLVVAKGGSGGTGVSTANIPQGGAGGVAGSETAAATGVLATGERGGNGSNFSFTGAFCSAGNGASGPYGTGGLGGIPSGSVAASGSAGSGFGSGGGGAGSNNTATDQAGGSGAAGIMIITEFLP